MDIDKIKPKTKDHHKDGMLTLQLQLEAMFNKNQVIPRITNEFKDSDYPFTQIMNQYKIDTNFGFNLLTHMAIQKRASLDTLIGLLRKHFDNGKRSSQAVSQMTADAIYIAAEADLVDWFQGESTFITKFNISDEVQKELDLYQYPLPMVTLPRVVNNNYGSGYYLPSSMANNGSMILRNNHHDQDICLDHINRVNRIRFALNRKVADTIKNSWANLDQRKPGEDSADYKKRVKAFRKYDTVTRILMDMLINEADELYLTHKYDKRGRVYCLGYHISYQGNQWNKAVIELADKEYIT